MSFSQLNLSKTAQVYADAVEVVADRQVDFSKMMDSIAQDILTDIASCYYNGNIIETRADRALHNIRGRMAAIRQMVSSMK